VGGGGGAGGVVGLGCLVGLGGVCWGVGVGGGGGGGEGGGGGCRRKTLFETQNLLAVIYERMLLDILGKG